MWDASAGSIFAKDSVDVLMRFRRGVWTLIGAGVTVITPIRSRL
jgi:hypothetical protein